MADSLAALFAPWRHANGALLGGKVLYACRTLPGERTLWAVWYVPYDDPDAARACLECLQLLHILSQIDGEVYQRLLDEVYDDLSAVIAEHPDCMAWRLGLQIQVDASTDFAMLRECFESVNPAYTASPRADNRSFLDARDALLRCSGTRARGSALPLWLSVWPGPGQEDRLDETLNRVRDLARDFAEEATQSRAIALVECCVELPCGPRIAELLGLVVDIMQCGVRISWLGFSSAPNVEPARRIDLTHALHSLLFPHTVGSGVASVAIPTAIHENIRSQICSALMYSPSVCQIVLDTTATDVRVDPERQSWRWLALALFSSQARNSIERLEINLTGLSADDVSIIEAVITADDPISATLNPGDTRTRVPHRQIAQLLPGTRVRRIELSPDDPRFESPDGCVPIKEYTGPVTVIHDSNIEYPWLIMMVPGVGPCWVNRNRLRFEATESYEHTNRINHLILTGITEQSASPALRLVQLIAHSTKTLEVHNMGNDLPSHPTWRAQCISACPALQQLIVDTHHPETIDAIIEVANSTSRSCPLQALRLEGIYSAGDFSSVHRLANALRDQHQQIAFQLRHLTISASEMTIRYATPLWMDLLNDIVGMLHQNKQLISCRVQLPRSIHADNNLRHQYQRFDGELLPLRVGPLALPCKLAFISVGRRGSHGLLMSDTLTVVFQFAAQCVRRECVLV